jgi:glycosyltransferase involved in cell wall biosynthesis
MIDHLHNGYVADYKSVEDFANGIHWALSESEYQSLSEEACRKVASSYSESAIAKRYIEIYNKIMGDND